MESSGLTTDAISKPNVDSIIGLSPSISIGQHVTNRNPRSTVGTVTDMYTYLRLIYEKIGERPCENCDKVPSNSVDLSIIIHEANDKVTRELNRIKSSLVFNILKGRGIT